VLPHRLKRSGLHSFQEARQLIDRAVEKIFALDTPLRVTEETTAFMEEWQNEDEAEQMQVPGNFAAGSILFDFLKKKARNTSPLRMN
jgi:hypothetical protein